MKMHREDPTSSTMRCPETGPQRFKTLCGRWVRWDHVSRTSRGFTTFTNRCRVCIRVQDERYLTQDNGRLERTPDQNCPDRYV